ncbi:SDR family oxidoreductase [Nakamurella sp. A5-74]|uniref:SDR family oxidoreductase n=1 Tax=Nakamurella sp. A5-74 TaxID=3158264 RepID=A0AAU8DNJ4_9ACTN
MAGQLPLRRPAHSRPPTAQVPPERSGAQKPTKGTTMQHMNNKIAVVTGGGSGIGLAIAEELVELGATVVITGRRQSTLDDATNRIGPACTGQVADVSSEQDMAAVYADVVAKHGRLDIVIANAGAGYHSVLGAITEKEFDATFNINAKGVLFTVQTALPHMSAGGSVVIVGSTASINPPRGMSMYGRAKAAVRDFIRSWIQDIKGTGIRINVLSPGAVDTESLRNALARAQGADQVQVGIERMGAGSPIGRIAQTSEIAKAVAFLASDDASFIHGVELFADGGLAQV